MSDMQETSLTYADWRDRYGVSVSFTGPYPERCKPGFKPSPALSDWQPGSRHYCAQLTHGDELLFETFYSMGPGLTEDPDADSLLDCIASDIAGVEDAGDVWGWMRDMGMELEQGPAAEHAFREVGAYRDLIRENVGDDALDALLYETERL